MTESIRFSRYNPAWRTPDGLWPASVWTDVFGSVAVGRGGLEDYLRVEAALCGGIEHVLALSSSDGVRIRGLELNELSNPRLAEIGLLVRLQRPLPDSMKTSHLTPVIRACLREQIWCEFDAQSIRVAVGHEMYVHARFVDPSMAAEASEQLGAAGLFTELFPYPWDD